MGTTAGDGAERTILAATAYLRALRGYGVEAFYGTAGTDFPSIIEAFAAAGPEASDMPEPVLVPHENLAVSMAHGHALATGTAQAVMVHVSVGTSNIVCGALNAIRDNVPMLLSAGRTPVTEDGPLGTRTRYIHWAQEMFDQAGMLREAVKWDYELRVPEQVESVVRRAIEVASLAPAGPVYLSLPRETLAAEVAAQRSLPPLGEVSRQGADPNAIDRLADMIRKADAPMIVTSFFGSDPEAVPVLAEVAERWAIPVVGMSARRVFLSAEHPMHLGFVPDALYSQSDLIIALDCEVPWIPAVSAPSGDIPFVQIGVDPIASRYPMRSFCARLSIPADSGLALHALGQALGAPGEGETTRVEARRARLKLRRQADLDRWVAQGAEDRLTPQTASAALRAHADPHTIVTNEYPLRLEQCRFKEPGTFFGLSPAGGLGWGLGAALGIKKALPERMVVSVLGDGAYMFNNPTACHFVAEASRLPVLTVIFNNGRWGAVRNSTLAMHGQGAAAAGNGELFADLSPVPAYERVIEAHDGLGLRATSLDELDAALDRGLAAVAGGRQALINVICDY
jgi:acetolactate synthase I/II/III large subunit